MYSDLCSMPLLGQMKSFEMHLKSIEKMLLHETHHNWAFYSIILHSKLL